MHILGKILAFFTVALGIGAIVLTTRTLQVRNEWMKSVTTKRAAYEETIPELARVKQELIDKRTQYELLVQLWAPMIGANVAITPNGQDGIILNGVGPASGIRQNQIIHVFSPDAAGGSNYIGPFKVNLVQAGRSGAVAAWPLRGFERANWARTFIFGNQCRVYGAVPTNAPETLLRYSQLLLSKDELLAAKSTLRDVRANEVQVANEHLTFRTNELHGDPSLQGDRGVLPDHMIDGLVTAIENLDEERNLTATEVDELRHRLKLLHDEVKHLQDRNRQLVNTLPAPSTPVAAN